MPVEGIRIMAELCWNRRAKKKAKTLDFPPKLNLRGSHVTPQIWAKTELRWAKVPVECVGVMAELRWRRLAQKWASFLDFGP